MHIHARAIDLYTCDTDIMKPRYPLSRRVHCKKQKHNSYWVHVQTYNINSKTTEYCRHIHWANINVL